MPFPSTCPRGARRRSVGALVAGAAAACAIWTPAALATSASTLQQQLNRDLGNAAHTVAGGHPLRAADARRIGKLASELRHALPKPASGCRAGLTAASRIPGDRTHSRRLRADIKGARKGIPGCRPSKPKPTKPNPPGGPSKHNPPVTPTKPPPVLPPPITPPPFSGVDEVKITSTISLDGSGPEDFCETNVDGVPGRDDEGIVHHIHLTFEADVPMGPSQSDTDTLALASGALDTLAWAADCEGARGAYRLTTWTNGQVHVSLSTDDDNDSETAVQLSVPQQILDQTEMTPFSYGPALPGAADPGDWMTDITYTGFKAGMSEEVTWPAPQTGATPSTTYVPLGVGGHVVAQMHYTKDLTDSPNLSGGWDILIQLIDNT